MSAHLSGAGRVAVHCAHAGAPARLVSVAARPMASRSRSRASAATSATPTTRGPTQPEQAPTSNDNAASTPPAGTGLPSALNLSAAKRILAPHLFPLSSSSPWQAAKADLATDADATPTTSARRASALRRPYAFMKRLSHHWLHRLARLLEYGLSSEGNAVEIYFDGDAAFQAMFDAIAAAEKRVCFETFMWKPDTVGLRIISLLEAAADRGCQVLVLYDAAGSFSLFSTYLSKLAAHPNAHVVAFNPVLGAIFRTTHKDFSHRTHRKILIADSIAFAGGMNTSEQYAGPKLGINEFRDTHMRIVGPAVDHLAEVFFQSMQEAHAHDTKQWRLIFGSVRARTATAVTQSSLFNTMLEMLAVSGTKSGAKAAKFFEQTRERQKLRLQQTQMMQQRLQAAVAKESTALGLGRLQTSTKRRSPRQSMRALRHFFSNRLHLLAEASTSSQGWAAFRRMELQAQRSWSRTWRKINRAARVTGAATPNKAADGSEYAATEVVNRDLSTFPTSTMASVAATLEPTAVTVQPVIANGTPASTSSTSSPSSSSAVTVASSSPGASAFTNVFLQVLPSNTIRQQFSIQHALIDVLENGMDYILITNPFLIPPINLKNAILNAGKRGVTVRIIVGGKSDTPYMRWSSHHIYHQFLAHPSIQIFEYQPRILHAKTITIDGLYSSIGSFNLDFLSSHKLLEVNIGMLSNEVARAMEKQHDEDIKECIQITKEDLKARSWPEKLLHWAAYHCSRTFYSIIE